MPFSPRSVPGTWWTPPRWQSACTHFARLFLSCSVCTLLTRYTAELHSETFGRQHQLPWVWGDFHPVTSLCAYLPTYLSVYLPTFNTTHIVKVSLPLQVMIHQSHPLDYIAFDRTMQDIVYKLVFGIQYEFTQQYPFSLIRYPLWKRTNTSEKEISMQKEACLVPRFDKLSLLLFET